MWRIARDSPYPRHYFAPREQFDRMTSDLLARTQATTDLVVENAGLNWMQINRVLLVGGMTRVPHVRNMIKRISGREPSTM